MPLYEYKCVKCGKIHEKVNSMDNHAKGPKCCGQKTRQHFGSYYVVGDLQPYVEENITGEPVLIKSRKHREQLMKENGVYEKVGKGWI